MGFEHEKPCRFEVTGISIFDFVARSIYQMPPVPPPFLRSLVPDGSPNPTSIVGSQRRSSSHVLLAFFGFQVVANRRAW